MTGETDPDQSRGRNKARGETVRTGIINSYETSFVESPVRAEAARQRVEEVIADMNAGLQRAGFPAEMLRAGLAEHGDNLRRVLSWAAFDYSFEHSDKTVHVVTSETMQLPTVCGLYIHENDFAGAVEFTEHSIIAMRLHRHTSGLGPVTNPDQEFADDFMAIDSEVPLPDTEADTSDQQLPGLDDLVVLTDLPKHAVVDPELRGSAAPYFIQSDLHLPTPDELRQQIEQGLEDSDED